jgi:hypothetical protein
MFCFVSNSIASLWSVVEGLVEFLADKLGVDPSEGDRSVDNRFPFEMPASVSEWGPSEDRNAFSRTSIRELRAVMTAVSRALFETRALRSAVAQTAPA